jgi:hypothetical protein
MSNLKPVKFS